VGVYYCNEKVDPEHWVKCVVNAWSLHHLLGTRYPANLVPCLTSHCGGLIRVMAAHRLSIPPIKTLAAPVEPSPWGMGTVVVVPMLLS